VVYARLGRNETLRRKAEYAGQHRTLCLHFDNVFGRECSRSKFATVTRPASVKGHPFEETAMVLLRTAGKSMCE
jgi:hypothetical protein